VNDSLGHAAGDAVLTTVASVLTRTVRRGDILFRLGGDEFCILLQALKLSEVKLIAQGIRVNIEDALRSSDGNPCAVAVSIGITAIDGKVSGDRVKGLADDAVYRAKAAGGDRIEC
jgi:diguanylate cyclase (GGDEF)-like protein